MGFGKGAALDVGTNLSRCMLISLYGLYAQNSYGHYDLVYGEYTSYGNICNEMRTGKVSLKPEVVAHHWMHWLVCFQ